MDDDRKRELFEQMWQRRKRVMNEIARKDRRREQEAIFCTLMDRGGESDEQQHKTERKG